MVKHPHRAWRVADYAKQGFVPIACVVADFIRVNQHLRVDSSKTDPDGLYGEPEVFTSWSNASGSGRVILAEHRWPNTVAKDAYDCEHYALGDNRADPAPVDEQRASGEVE